MTAARIYTLNELSPSEAVHPGEIIKDELEARGMSQRQFASLIDCSYTVLNEILNAKRPVTADYALRIEAALGIKAYLLVNMQSEYNLQVVRRDNKMVSILNKIRSATAML